MTRDTARVAGDAFSLLRRGLHALRCTPTGTKRTGSWKAGFTLAKGTNPELALFIEARVKKGSTQAVWRYTVGRLAHAELRVLYEGKEVFSAPGGNRVSGAASPYWLGFIPVERRRREATGDQAAGPLPGAHRSARQLERGHPARRTRGPAPTG